MFTFTEGILSSFERTFNFAIHFECTPPEDGHNVYKIHWKLMNLLL